MIENNAFDIDFSSSDTIKPGLLDLSSRILGPNSVTQAALPHILSETPDSYHEDIMNQLEVLKTFLLFHLVSFSFRQTLNMFINR